MLLKQVRSLASSAVSNVKAHHMIDKWRSQLKMHGICDFDASANHLVQHVCKSITKTKVLTLEQVNEINEICYKRCQRIPTQYLIGEWPFRDTSLILKPPVFIPRPETEMLIDYVLESVCHIGKDNGVTFIDMGCGSGPICVSLLQENQQLRGWAIDVSPEAVNLTKQNAIRNGVIDRLQIKNYSINDVRRNCDVTFDIIISNPPYIKREDIPNLQPEIINYEDHKALDGGSDGLNIIEQVITAGSELLTQQGLIWLESSLDQGQNIKEMVIRKYPQIAYINQYPDITGRYRFHLLRKV